MLTDVEFDAFEVWIGKVYAEKGVPPTAEEVRPSPPNGAPPRLAPHAPFRAQAKEFGLALNVTDHNPPIDPRLPRFDRVRDSLGKAMPF